MKGQLSNGKLRTHLWEEVKLQTDISLVIEDFSM